MSREPDGIVEFHRPTEDRGVHRFAAWMGPVTITIKEDLESLRLDGHGEGQGLAQGTTPGSQDREGSGALMNDQGAEGLSIEDLDLCDARA